MSSSLIFNLIDDFVTQEYSSCSSVQTNAEGISWINGRSFEQQWAIWKKNWIRSKAHIYNANSNACPFKRDSSPSGAFPNTQKPPSMTMIAYFDLNLRSSPELLIGVTFVNELRTGNRAPVNIYVQTSLADTRPNKE